MILENRERNFRSADSIENKIRDIRPRGSNKILFFNGGQLRDNKLVPIPVKNKPVQLDLTGLSASATELMEHLIEVELPIVKGGAVPGYDLALAKFKGYKVDRFRDSVVASLLSLCAQGATDGGALKGLYKTLLAIDYYQVVETPTNWWLVKEAYPQGAGLSYDNVRDTRGDRFPSDPPTEPVYSKFSTMRESLSLIFRTLLSRNNLSVS